MANKRRTSEQKAIDDAEDERVESRVRYLSKAHGPYFYPDNDPNGTEVPSVTTILEKCDGDVQFLLEWAWNMGASRYKVLDDQGQLLTARIDLREYRRQAGQLGSCVHERIRAYCEKQPPQLEDVSPAQLDLVQGSVNRWLAWYELQIVDLLGCEVKIITPDYAGTCDWIGYLNGKLTFIDWKTGKGAPWSVMPQLAAYAHGWLAEHAPDKLGDPNAVDLVSVHVPLMYGFKVDTRPNLPEFYNVFDLCRRLYHARAAMSEVE
jgi:hypothetical protein